MKHLKVALISLLKVSLLSKSDAFNALPPSFHRLSVAPKSFFSRVSSPSSTSLSGKYANNREGDNTSARTDINQFLTQRTIQTFIHLLKQFRDPHTGVWIEDFIGTKNLLNYHGTGAVCMSTFPNWDSVFAALIEQKPEVVIVEIKATNAGRGLSKNNPYREKEDRVIEIEIDIDPPSLANRMLAVREKIASEFVKDLDLVIAANKDILSSYNKKCLDARKDEECSKTTNEEEEEDRCTIEPLQAGSMSGDFNFGQRTIQSFDREAVYMINNHPNFNNPESTLLRSTSFDLLFLLSTQESIHRVLKSYKKAGEDKEVSFAWLLDYYNNSLDKYFDGNQSFGRADDFLDDLFQTPPSLKTFDDKVGFIDPLLIAEEIIKEREEVAKKWKNLISLVPQDQEKIRQAVFVKQMAKWGHPVVENNPQTKAEEEKIVGEEGEEINARNDKNEDESEVIEEIHEGSKEIRAESYESEDEDESKKTEEVHKGSKDIRAETYKSEDEDESEETEEVNEWSEDMTTENQESEDYDEDEDHEEIEEPILVQEFSLLEKLSDKLFARVEIYGEFE